ncbi:MAG TPA: cytochrome P450 [Catenuloplanes sp.]|jgi:cytochrome P450
MVSDVGKRKIRTDPAPDRQGRMDNGRPHPVASGRAAARVPVYRNAPRLVRDPLPVLEAIGRERAGEIVRLDLGLFRPYLITDPGHVQQVLRDRADNYVREGMLWNPVRRLIGDGISGEGPVWRRRRDILQPLFAGKHIDSLAGQLATAVAEAVDALDGPARAGRPIDVDTEMTRIVHGALIRAFFGGGISVADGDRLGAAIATAFTSLGARMVLPFVPNAVPLPGDRAFRRAVRTVDDIMVPLVRHRRTGHAADDLVGLLCRAVTDDGRPLDDREVRDDVVALFVAATETTAMALTWLWVALDGNPEVARTLRGEVDRVVGAAAPTPAHLSQLPYTRMVLRELLRLYPVAWFLPRSVRRADVIAGVRIDAGSTVVLSPYLTHRLPGVWQDPLAFSPERFAPEQAAGRHRYAYFPFGAGPHQCLGSHLFMMEATLIVATMLSRYRPEPLAAPPVAPRAAVTLRPSRRVEMVLRPVSPP